MREGQSARRKKREHSLRAVQLSRRFPRPVHRSAHCFLLANLARSPLLLLWTQSVVSKHHTSLEKLFLSDILPACSNSLLRGVAASALTKLLEHNSGNVSNWYHELLGKFLEQKELGHRVVGLAVFASLTRTFGSQFILSIPETLAVLARIAKARDEIVLRELILDVIRAYYESTGGSPRSAGSNESTHLEPLKLLTKFAGETGKSSPASLKQRCMATAVAIAYFSTDGREIDGLVSLALKTLQGASSLVSDSSSSEAHEIRYAAAEALGDMFALACRKDWGAIAADAAKKAAAGASSSSSSRAAKKIQGELRSVDEVMIWFDRQFATTNTRSSAAAAITPANLAVRAALNQALARFFKSASLGNAHNLAAGGVRLGFSVGPGGENSSGELSASLGQAIDESNVVALEQKCVAMLSKGKFTAGASSSSQQVVLGGASTLAIQTLPLPRDSVVDSAADQNTRQMMSLLSHTLLGGLLPYTSERGLEAVGKSVVGFLLMSVRAGSGAGSGGSSGSASLASNDLQSNYQVLLCFHILAFIFSRLGLAVEFLELKDQCLEALLAFLPHPQYAVRIACAQCFRALARAASPAIATWISVLYKIVVLQLGEVTESEGMIVPASASGKKATAIEVDPAPYYSLHGHISALAAIVSIIPEAPCGVPSSILDSVFDVCKKLLSLAPPEGAPAAVSAPNNLHVHSLVEGGWTLLSSLVSLGSEWVSSRINGLFLLWRGCLGRKPAAGRQKQDDINLELKLRWRALLALRTFAHVMRFKMTCPLAPGGTPNPSPILKATVIFLRNTFSLLKALTSGSTTAAEKGATGGAAATAASVSAPQQLDPSVALSCSALKSVLMDLFAALPVASFQATLVPLLHLVVSEFTSKNPPLSTELNRILNRADASLNFPSLAPVGPQAQGTCHAEFMRFVDLSDASEPNPQIHPVSGNPIASPSSFYEQWSAAGSAQLMDASWDWVLKCQVYTDVAREISNHASNGGASPGPGTAHGGSIGGGPGEGGLDEGLAGEKVLDSSTGALDSFDDSCLAASGDESAAAGGSGSSDDASAFARPLWTSLRNHADRGMGCGAGGFAGTHSSESYESAPVRSVNSCIRLFGTLCADQSPTHKEQLLKHFLAIVLKAKSMHSLHSNIVTNAATALLAVARDLAERENQGGIRSAPALELLLTIAQELMSTPNPLVRRAVGELLGLLVRVESADDQFLARLFQALQNHLHSKDPFVVSTAVFSLGCVHRYGGAMKTMRYLPFTVAALQSLARDFSEPNRIWILHALWLAVETGGLSFAAYVQPTLAILQAHAAFDMEARNPIVTQEIGCIIHAVLGALGPDVAASGGSGGASNGVDKFLNLWAHLQMDPALYAQIEVISILHQLVLWSEPMEYPGILPLLTRALSHEDEDLRRTAVKCLLQFGEKDPSVILRRDLEKRMLAMVETETSPSMQALVKHTVASWIMVHATSPNTALNGSASAALAGHIPAAALSPGGIQATPRSFAADAHAKFSTAGATAKSGEESIRFRLFDVCKRSMVGSHKLPSDSQTLPAGSAGAATNPKKKAAASSAKTPDTSKDDDEDDEGDGGILGAEDEERPKKGGAGGSGASAKANSGDSASLSDRLFALTETRWQTKTFALDCLSSLLRIGFKSAPREVEFDLAYARRHARYPLEYLVQQLPDLLTVACLATSSLYDMLRLKGTNTMKLLVEVFGDVADPDAALVDQDEGESAGGELLLQLYAAQVTSALSQSLKNKSESFVSAPQLRSRACELAWTYLVSGVTSDPMVQARMVKLLLHPVQHSAEIIANLNGQFDGNMSTLVILSHLNALAQLHSAVLSAPVPSGSRKKSKPLTPKQQALVSLREVLAPSFPLLLLHYSQALKDYTLVSLLGRREIARLQGFYFDGANASQPLQVYQHYWEGVLSIIARNLENSGDEGDAVLAAVVASDGSVGGERSRRELVAIALGVIAHTLSLVAGIEARSASSSSASMAAAGSPLNRAISDGSKSGSGRCRSNFDQSVVAAWASRDNLASGAVCLRALSCLLSPRHLRRDIISLPMLAELLPALAWNLEHRPAGAEILALQRRQEVVLAVYATIMASLREVLEDPTRLESFLGPPPEAAVAAVATSSAPDSAVSTLFDVFHSLAQALSSTVFHFLPSYGASAGQSQLQASSRLADSSVYLTPDVAATLAGILALLPTFVNLVGLAATRTGFAEGAQVHAAMLCMSVGLCEHVMRKATSELAGQALTTVQSLVFLGEAPDASSASAAGGAAGARTVPPLVLVQLLSQQLGSVLMAPLPLNADFRVEYLLGALWSLSIATVPDDASDESVAAAVSRFLSVGGVFREFLSHASSRFRMLALGALKSHILALPVVALAPATSALQQRALAMMISQLSPDLCELAEVAETVDESAASLQSLLNVFHALTSPASADLKTTLLSFVLPLAIDHLDRNPRKVPSVLAFATQHAGIFKATVVSAALNASQKAGMIMIWNRSRASDPTLTRFSRVVAIVLCVQPLLPLDYRSRLQRAIMSMSAEQQAAVLSQVHAFMAQHKQQTDAAALAASPSSSAAAGKGVDSTTKSAKSKPGKTKRDSASAAGAAPPAIALSMDFGKFTKKK